MRWFLSARKPIRPTLAQFADTPWAILESHFERALAIVSAPKRRDPLAALLYESDEDQTLTRVGNVAILSLVGVLAPQVPWWRVGTSTEQFARQFSAVVADSGVKRILIRVDSPGGVVYGTEELGNLIYQARGTKPIDAWIVNGLGASAAYWIASAADRIYATPSSQVGSIGVIMAHVDQSGAEKNAGFKVTVLAKPAGKKVGNEHEPLSAADRAKLEAEMLDPYYTAFAAAVARNRGVTVEAVEAGYGQGGVLVAKDAVDAGLIDAVRDWNAYLESLAAPGSGAPAIPPLESPPMKFSARTLAALFAAGLIDALDAPEATVTAAVKAYALAKGQPMPETDEAAQALAKLALAPPAAAAPPAPPVAQPVDVAAAVAAEVAKINQANEARRADLLARAELLGIEASHPDLVAAIAAGQTGEQFVAAVTDPAKADRKPVGRIIPTGCGADKWAEAAVLGVLAQVAEPAIEALASAGTKVNRAAAEAWQKSLAENQDAVAIANTPFSEIVRNYCERFRVPVPADQRTAEGFARAFLRVQGHNDWTRFSSGHARMRVSATSSPIWQVGDYPTLLDGIAAKLVYAGQAIAPVSYAQYCRRLPDVADVRSPREILRFGRYKQLDLHVDGKDFKELAKIPTTNNWILGDEYANEVALTPLMIQRDQFGVFAEAIMSMAMAAEATVNQMCFDILDGNVTWPADATACYSHDNDQTDGGGPLDTDQVKEMRQLLMKQKFDGAERTSGLQMALAVVGTNWWDDALAKFLSIERLVYATDANAQGQLYRQGGPASVQPVYEPLLDGAAGTGVKWYGTASPAIEPGIGFAFETGYGAGGNRDSYYEARNETTRYRLKLRVQAALMHPRALVRNSGVATP